MGEDQRVAKSLFQSAPSHEGEQPKPKPITPPLPFQSAPSHEGELPKSSTRAVASTFQSAPSHEGERDVTKDLVQDYQVSIRALARGRTRGR